MSNRATKQDLLTHHDWQLTRYFARCEDSNNLANRESNSVIARMIERRVRAQLIDLINHNPAVCMLGPRQVGKTTLALTVAASQPSLS
jgi:hypothetical protein